MGEVMTAKRLREHLKEGKPVSSGDVLALITAAEDAAAERMRGQCNKAVQFYVDDAWKHGHTLSQGDVKVSRRLAIVISAVIRDLPLHKDAGS